MRGIGYNRLFATDGTALNNAGSYRVKFEGGTFDFGNGKFLERPYILGGSVNVRANTYPKDGPATDGTNAVWRVTVPGLEPYAPVQVGGLSADYDISEIYADGDGRIYLWLPEDTHVFTANGANYAATVVRDAYATAEPLVTGVTVNGADVGSGSGDGWTYDAISSNLVLSADGLVVSGTRTDGRVRVSVSAGSVRQL